MSQDRAQVVDHVLPVLPGAALADRAWKLEARVDELLRATAAAEAGR